MATLLLSQGVPMILGGDELGRTQRGNNNAYCQDNEISWYNWNLNPDQEDFCEFVSYVIHLLGTQPVLTRRRFFEGRAIRGQGVTDIAWIMANGEEMDDAAWNSHFVRCFGVRLVGTEIHDVDDMGEPITGDTLFLIFNAHHERTRFILPPHREGQRWERLLDTSLKIWNQPHRLRDHSYRMQGRSVAVFRVREEETKVQKGGYRWKPAF